MIARMLPFGQPFRRRPFIAVADVGGTTTLMARSWLREPVFFLWWVNGIFQGKTLDGGKVVRPEDGEQLRVELFDTRNPSFDPSLILVQSATGRRRIFWTRSLDANIAAYRIDGQAGTGGPFMVGGSSWQTLATVAADDTWQYAWLSDPCADLAPVAWRIVPLDAAGNAGTAKVISAEMIVRTPDAPRWAFELDSVSRQVTFSAV